MKLFPFQQRWLLPAIGCFFASLATVQAQTLINQNFNGSTLGSDTGAGTPITNTGLEREGPRTHSVQATSGVGGSQALNGGADMAPRSISTYSLENEITFDVFFQWNQPASVNTGQGPFGVGWSNAADAQNNFNGGQNDRFAVGLKYNDTLDPTEVTFSSFGQFSSMTALSGSPTFNLVDGNWFRFQATLDFDDATDVFTLSGLSVDDYGSNGTSLVGNLGTIGSATVDISSGAVGSNLKDDGSAHFIVLGSNGRGVNTIDNLVVTAVVPEPSAALLLIAASGLLLMGRRRSVRRINA